jgi:acetyl-CoA carboxylase biotin carboxyl carrier protein
MSGLSRSDIEEILRLLDDSDFDELRLEIGETKLEIRRNGGGSRRRPTRTPSPSATPPEPPRASAPAAPAPTPSPSPSSPAPGVVDVPAPQLGIFYHAPKPGEPPFVSVGDEVEPDTVIGIIEVMKLMNTVSAGVTGTVVEVVAPNGESIKAGDTLIRVRPAAGGGA